MIRTLLLTLGFAVAAAFAPAAAQANDFDCDVDEQQVLIKYSLYFENYRADNFEAALPDLEWMLACAPGFAGRSEDDRNFRRAVEVHETLAQRATDPQERQEHLERALDLIQSAVPTLVDAGVDVDEHAWLIRKGRFIQEYEQAFADSDLRACDAYEDAFALDAEATDDFYLQMIAFCRAEDAAGSGSTPAERREAREFIEDVLLAHASDQGVRDYIEVQAERLITTPREQFAFLHERYTEGGAEALSEEDLEQLFRLNQQAGAELIGATESRALHGELLPIVAELSPSYSRFTNIGTAELAEGNHERAMDFFERALEIAEEPNQRRDAYYHMARVRDEQNQRQGAANFLREALSIDSRHGPSMFLMGSLIHKSVRNDDIDSRAAYWCAADWYSRAAGQGVANASAAAQNALRGAPTSEEYFFKGWRPGQTVTARYGWGSCQATVR